MQSHFYLRKLGGVDGGRARDMSSPCFAMAHWQCIQRLEDAMSERVNGWMDDSPGTYDVWAARTRQLVGGGGVRGNRRKLDSPPYEPGGVREARTSYTYMT